MKLDDFTKYKKLAESADPDMLPPEALRIYQWMEEKGRIDEGFWSSIWKWLKRNLSPKSRKLHALAEEYEKELTEELRAEYDATVKKDLAAKFRKSSYMRLSHDIEQRMDIIAGDDQDYRELVKALINKKNYKVRKTLLIELAGKMDPEDYKASKEWVTKGDEDASNRLTAAEKKEMKDDLPTIRELSIFLKRKLSEEKRFFDQIQLGNTDAFTGMIALYVVKLSNKRIKGFEKDKKTAFDVAKKYVETVKMFAEKLEKEGVSKEDSFKIVKIALNKLIKMDSVEPLEKLKGELPRAIAEIKKKFEEDTKEKPSDEDELEKGIVTDTTEEVTDVPVEDMVDTAKDETGKKNPTKEEISEEIKDTIKQYFTNSFDTFFENLKTSVEKFNGLSDEEKTKLKGKFEYTLDKDNKLPIPTEDDVKTLLHDFVKIAGKIVPFYQHVEKSAKTASIAVSDSLFEIYAIKKDVEKKLSEDDIDKIVEVIKTKNLL